MIALKIAAAIVGVYAGIRLGAIAIEWLRVGLEYLRPPRYK